jgi:hypothetical protein
MTVFFVLVKVVYICPNGLAILNTSVKDKPKFLYN